MALYALTLSYRGSAYAGWQRQANALAVQQVVEEALGDLLGTPVRVVGAGRTDAGVHARGQVAHLDLAAPFPEGGLLHGTNRRLPEDVRVLAARRMAAGFHARKSARGKLYRYRLVRARVLSPLDAPYAVRVDPDLDLGAMERAAAALPGRHDFSAFALAGGAHRDPRRRIFAARFVERGEELTFEIEGDGFLRGMVRGLVGTLLEVGAGRRTVEGFAALLADAESEGPRVGAADGAAPRAAAGPTAPARGLVLERVFYPPLWEAAGL